MTADSLADAIMFLGFAMLVVQRGTLAARWYLPAWTPVRPQENRT